MRNILLLTLISIALTTPALAAGRHDTLRYAHDRGRVERGWHEGHHQRRRDYARLHRRVNHLRRDLRHERRENRHLRKRMRYGHRRHYRSAPVVVARRDLRPLWLPRIVVRIPLNW